MSGLSLSFPYWFLGVSLIGGALYALQLYYKTRDFEGKAKWIKPLLGGLRFFSIATLIFLLLNPIIRSLSKRVKRPIVLLAMDNSSSVKGGFHNAKDSLHFVQSIDNLIHQIEKDYQVEPLLFGETVRAGDTLDFKDKETDISQVLETAYRTYRNENIGAILLATDGNYNKGSHPLYTNPQLQAPIYTLVMGDTTHPKDISISAVYHNDIAYLGDLFQVHVDIRAHLLKGKKGRLQILGKKSGKFTSLDQKDFVIEQTDFFKSFTLSIPALTSGYQRFIVKVTRFSDEANTDNNTSNFYVDVLEARQNILILADGPHPDIGTIKQALAANKNNQVTIQYADDFNFSSRETDLVILHQLPSYLHPVSKLLKDLKEKHIPTLFITGLQTKYLALNEAQDAVFIRPGNRVKISEVTASINRNFNGFHLSERLSSNLEGFPSLVTAYGSFKPKPNAQVFLKQKILKVETENPLMVFSNRNGRKCGVLCAEGIYKWRLFDFLHYHTHDITEELIQNIVRYLIVKEDKSRFRVKPTQAFFKESDRVRFYAERYNSIYEKDNSAEVDFTLKDSADNTYKYTFSRTEDAYTLDIGKLPAGTYKYTASTQLDGIIKHKSGSFTVSIIDIENTKTNANLPLLLALAEQSGGQTIYPSQLDSLPQLIRAEHRLKPISYNTVRTRPLIHLKWPLFLLLLTLSIEWFLRRYHGKY